MRRVVLRKGEFCFADICDGSSIGDSKNCELLQVIFNLETEFLKKIIMIIKNLNDCFKLVTID